MNPTSARCSIDSSESTLLDDIPNIIGLRFYVSKQRYLYDFFAVSEQLRKKMSGDMKRTSGGICLSEALL